MSEESERVLRTLHAERADRAKGDPVATPVAFAAKFHLPGDTQAQYQYGRFHNPTWSALEAALAVLEGAETRVFPSGMAAVSAVLYGLLKAGDRVLLPSDGYYTVRALADRFLKPLGVSAVALPTAQFETADPSGYRLVWIETPSNPGLELCDIARVAARAKAAGALVAVDNTTMTPLGQRPLDLGADVVVSSDTKALAGHGDVLAGHVATRDPKLLEAMADWRKLAGAIIGPMEAFLVLRGLQSLELRFERMCGNASLLAQRLAAHKRVKALRYPAGPLIGRQMTTGGFLIGLTLESAAAADGFIGRCRALVPATSFGGVQSSAERRGRWGDAVEPGFVRLSVGCEPTEALWSALAEALDAS
ncbi:MAG: cystathionine gamma-lyase [Alphaproteobacteria bacterium]|nr:cystathionine gamma-lyase [Alphaproteobacteria bacterium]